MTTVKMPDSEAEIKNRERAPPGQVVDCGRKSFIVEGLIGSGRYGDVYQVHKDGINEIKYAMKTERMDVISDQKKRRIWVEKNVYDSIQLESEKIVDKTNLPKAVICGKNSHYEFLVMELVGPSLYDVRVTMMRGYTSPRTIAHIARQTLQAIEALHELGWLHRDVKPHNFAIGMLPKSTTIMLYDFGLARRFRTKDGGIRVPRRYPLWVGTIRYASARGLRGREELARRDDIESWCYMMLEYYYRKNLLWRDADRQSMIEMKEQLMAAAKMLRANRVIRVPQRFVDILTMTYKLSYAANPDYNGMHAILDQIIKDEEIDMNLPLDWIGRSMPVAEKIDEEKLRLEVARRKELEARKKKLEQRLVQLFAMSGEPKTLDEVRVYMRRKDAKLRKVEDLLNQSDEDKEREENGRTVVDEKPRNRRKHVKKTQETLDDTNGDRRDRSGMKKKKNEKKKEKGKEVEKDLKKKLTLAEEEKQERRAAKEVTIDEVTVDMVREMLEVVGERKKLAGESDAEYGQMARNIAGYRNQAILDKMWCVLDKHIYEEEVKNVTQELREIIEGGNDKKEETKKNKMNKDLTEVTKEDICVEGPSVTSHKDGPAADKGKKVEIGTNKT